LLVNSRIKKKQVSIILRIIVTLFMISLICVSQTMALTLVLQPGPGANDGSDLGDMLNGKDAGVFNGSGNSGNNIGTARRQYTQYNSATWNAMGYYQFDFSSYLSSTDVITTAELTFHHLYLSAKDGQGNHRIWSQVDENYAVRGVQQAWNEMDITYNSQPLSDSHYSATSVVYPRALTWNEATAGNLLWADVGDDEHTFAIASVTLDVTGLVQDWHTGVRNNYGLLYQTTDGGSYNAQDGYVISSDALNEIYRPKLTVTYEPVPEPGTILLMATGMLAFTGARRRKS